MQSSKKLAFFLPNTFTALNMGCGFASIIFSWQGNMYNACLILLLGAIFDSVDGRVARLTGTESSFGEQFDSISDVVSFGVAPAFLIYNQFLADLGRLGIVVAFIYTLCGALRLARFNANIEKISSDYFQGLPIPSGALGVMGFVLWSIEYPALVEMKFIAIVYSLFFSLLMISNIPFYSFKNADWVKRRRKQVLALIFLLIALIFTYEQLMIGVIMLLYVLGVLIYYFTHKGALDEVFSWKNEEDN